MPLRVADLEVLFTANTADVERAEKQVVKTGKDIESKPIEQKIDANEAGALAGMDRVETAAKKLVSHSTAVTIDSNIERAEKGIDRTQKRLDYLRSVETELDVSADIKRAEASLQKLTRQRDALTKSRESVEIDANTIPAEDGIKDLEDNLDESSTESGKKAGGNLGKGIIAALAAIPVAGAIVGIASAVGDAIGEAFESGLRQEVTRDRIGALTGIDEAAAIRIAHASGEAYALTFGESMEQNMDTARLALQFNILDEDGTTRDAEKVIKGLAGIADVLGEDVQPIATAVATLLSTGIANNADQAFDLIAAGAREGLNRNEDLLDVLTEYPALFKRLGLTGEEALGLVGQGMRGGARNADLAADALKEFQIRATDASEASAEGFTILGLNAEEMTAKIARGGEDARDGLAEVLDKLRETEDPVKRNAAAVALFGTQAEDLGDALFEMDLSTAVDQLDGVTGSAQKMFDTLRDNDATKLEGAKRNIETAVSGIQGALAAAFSEPLGEFAEWVSQNRGPLMQFLLDLSNGAIDFGISVVEAAANGAEAFGEFVAGPLAMTVSAIASAIKWTNPFADTSGLDEIADNMRDFDTVGAEVADRMRGTMVPALEDARDRLNEFGDGAVAQAHVHDASLRTVDAITKLEEAAERGNGALKEQARSAVEAIAEEIEMATQAGESQDNLTERYNTAREGLIGQLEQAGLSSEEAAKLIDGEQEKLNALARRVETLPDGKITIRSDAEQAKADMAALQEWMSQHPMVRSVSLESYTLEGGRTVSAVPQREGHVVEFMARGGLTPMDPIAQMVPANTWRVVGDRSDVPELYAPLDGSDRSWALLMEGLRRMPGVMPMAEGGVVNAARSTSGEISVQFGDIVVSGANLSAADVLALVQQAVRDELRRTFGDRGGL